MSGLRNRRGCMLLSKLKRHAGVSALVVAVVALVVALTGIAGALPGAQRATAKLKVVQRTGETGTIQSGNSSPAAAKCNNNEEVVGGGFSAESGFGRIDSSRPLVKDGDLVGWHIDIGNNSPGTAKFEVEVLCARIK